MPSYWMYDKVQHRHGSKPDTLNETKKKRKTTKEKKENEKKKKKKRKEKKYPEKKYELQGKTKERKETKYREPEARWIRNQVVPLRRRCDRQYKTNKTNKNRKHQEQTRLATRHPPRQTRHL